MKLIISVIRDSDSETVSQSLIRAGYRVTRIASTGGFLRRGSTTLMVGTEDELVDNAIDMIKQNVSVASEAGVPRATLFVLNVDHFTQI